MTDTPKAGGGEVELRAVHAAIFEIDKPRMDRLRSAGGSVSVPNYVLMAHAAIDALATAPTRAPSPAAMATGGTSGWLVERGGQWFGVTHTDWEVREALDPRLWQDNWTSDANNALRFARKADAEAMIRKEGWQNAIATEHVFLAPSPAPMATGVEVETDASIEVAASQAFEPGDHLFAGFITGAQWLRDKQMRAASAPTRVGDGELRAAVDRVLATAKAMGPHNWNMGGGLLRKGDMEIIAAALRASDAGGGDEGYWNERPTGAQAAEIENNDGPLSRGQLHPWDFFKIIRAAGAPPPPAAGGRGDEGMGS